MSIESDIVTTVKTDVTSVTADVTGKVTAVETTLIGKIKTAATYWPYWAPVVVLGLVVGHLI